MPVRAHQPLDAVTAEIDALTPEGELQLAVAEGLKVRLVHLTDAGKQLLVGDRAGRPSASRASARR
jgi:hypothetical protein